MKMPAVIPGNISFSPEVLVSTFQGHLNFKLSLSKMGGTQRNLQVKDIAYKVLHNFSETCKKTQMMKRVVWFLDKKAEYYKETCFSKMKYRVK